jgi:antitoxin VapB
MPLNIRSEEVNRLAEKLAIRKHVSKTEAVRRALQNELSRSVEAIPLWERLKPLREKIAAYPDTGLVADKTFFDELSGED